MKFLIDQNISHRLKTSLSKFFPNIKHIKELSLERASDEMIWEYAKENDFIILTKDSDFNDIAVMKGYPPKIIWIQKGNCSTDDIINLIIENHRTIIEFVGDKENSILIIS